MITQMNRRNFLASTSLLATAPCVLAQSATGRVEGNPLGSKVGTDILAVGGNAVDAIVAAAFTASVVAPGMCGPGGYGGSFIAAIDRGRKIVSVDFNSTAPASAHAEMFRPDSTGKVKGNINIFGWKAAGVPGTLAGLQQIARRFGTKPVSQLISPAAELARTGFKVDSTFVAGVRAAMPQFQADPGSRELYLRDGEVPNVGTLFKNPDLARLLDSFVRAGTVDDFYKGDAAKQIARAFRENGGLVTEQDLAAYRPRESIPARWNLGSFSVYTPAPTAGGVTVLQALAILEQIGWAERRKDQLQLLRARLETLRLCWNDRLSLLGDPDFTRTKWQELLDEKRLRSQADQVNEALQSGKPVLARTDGRTCQETIHLSAADVLGNFAALTLTHGGFFGARVTVPGLGVTLGHGMSRFDPQPGFANSPGPGKRPLHNMCPTVVLKEGSAVLALGGRGGRKIPNAVFEVLAQHLLLGKPLKESITAPRIHTEGGMKVDLESSWDLESRKMLESSGYQVTQAAHATVSAVWANGSASR